MNWEIQMAYSDDRVYFEDDAEYFRVFNFHRSELLQQVINLIQGEEIGQSRIVRLRGLKGIGKEYLLRAAAFEVCASGHPMRVAAMDLAAWNPDDGTLESYLDALKSRLSRTNVKCQK